MHYVLCTMLLLIPPPGTCIQDRWRSVGATGRCTDGSDRGDDGGGGDHDDDDDDDDCDGDDSAEIENGKDKRQKTKDEKT